MSNEVARGTDSHVLLEQRIRYAYDRPIRRLNHRLIVIPRAQHGAQLRSDFEVSASEPSARVTVTEDAFANCVVAVVADEIAGEIEFSIRATVVRRHDPTWSEGSHWLEDPRLLLPTALTRTTKKMSDVGQRFAATGASASDVGEMACRWASRAISYGYGVTNIHTTAAAALRGRMGVCQDYAHIMIAICRAAGVPTRYVSGHLTGEGGSHAWVEVLHSVHPGGSVTATGFDPTHDRRTDGRYLTVAVGRDYSDVAPTSGTFQGHARGTLHVSKQVTAIAADALQSSRDDRDSTIPRDSYAIVNA